MKLSKLSLSSNGFINSITRSTLTRVFGVSFYSTKTQSLESNKPKRDTLFSRISPISNSSVSIVPILEQWVEEGKSVKRLEIVHMIKQFRVFKRYKHALEISQWMSDRNYLVLSPGDISVRLDLISKVNGIEQAEMYFDNIPEKLKTFPVYSALLSCYAQSKSVEKAEAVMQQMRELEFTMSPLAYNVLLNLYSQLGQYEKLDILMEEMEKNGVHPDKFTYSIRLSAYAATSDIDGMEKTFQRMSLDPEVDMDWSCYVIPANGYIKAGLNDKALGMLKKSEELITEKKKRVAYEFLLTMYAGAGSKENLYRIWKLYKSSDKLYNKAYLCMIGSLLKLDDIAGAEKILEEWENGDTIYDSRVPDLLIAAYCKDGLLEKAERLVIEGIEKGNKPCPNTWEILASGYVKANQMPQAVRTLKSAYLATRPGWKPNRETLTSCLVYLKQQGDLKQAKEFVRLLGAAGNLSKDIWKKLQDYIHNRTTEIDIMNEIDGDGSNNDEETDGLTKEAAM